MKIAVAVLVAWPALAGLARAEDCPPCASPAAGSDPNYSRLLFAPTARPLARGDGYFSDYALVFPGVAVGLTDTVSIAGGMSLFPFVGLGEQVFYVAPKVGWNLGDGAAIAVGGLAATAGGDGDRLGIGYAMGTLGGRDRSLTAGLGVFATDDDSSTVPILMVGGNVRLSRHVALVGETWVPLGDAFEIPPPIGIGVRLFGERLSADLGVIVWGEMLDQGFPLPWLSVTYAFGPSGR